MMREAPTLLARARRGLSRRVARARNHVEWRTVRALSGDVPWCSNQWGHRYQAMSLTEYHYLRDGNPETHEARLLARLLRPGMTVVDVGANHGLFALEALHWIGPTGRLDAFEPTPRTCERLKRNLAVNGLGHVRVFDSALRDVPGSARLRVHHEWTGLNSLADHDITWNRGRLVADEVIEVPATTLDAHAQREGIETIDFLKIDVEGFELFVLRGAQGLLRARRVRWLMIEVGDQTCANAKVDPRELLELLDALGYELHEITATGLMGPIVRAFRPGSFSANFLAIGKAHS